MKKRLLHFLIVLGILLVLAAAATIYYFKYISYPLDKDGMVYSSRGSGIS